MNAKLTGKLNGRECLIYFIGNDALKVGVCELGASINSLFVNGVDIALGFNTVEDYLQSGSFAGATMGRVANRIEGGRFVLNGRPYFLSRNEGNNHLHGGNIGFDKKLFDAISYSKNSVTLQYTAKDGEEGYPGKLVLSVKFTVEGNSLTIEYTAISDKDTLWSPTSHVYFNLDGENSGDCANNLLRINADCYTPANGLVPTGEKASVDGTAFDFRTLRTLNAAYAGGYDDNFILNGGYAARAESQKTGIKMDLYTDMPCLQLYTAGALKPCRGKKGYYDRRAGFCLEPQFCPNAINMNGFEKPIIKKDILTTHFIKYVFNG